MARCRPHRIAASFPRTLDGMARIATRKLTVIGVSTAEPSWRAATNAQKATIQVRDAIELEAMRAVAEDVAHGGAIAQHRSKIEQPGLARRRLYRPEAKGDGDHCQRPQPGENEGIAPAQVLSRQLRCQEGETDAEARSTPYTW